MKLLPAWLCLFLLAGCAGGGGYTYDPASDCGYDPCPAPTDHPRYQQGSGDALLNLAAQLLRGPQMPAYQPRNTTCQPTGGGAFSCQSW